VFDKEFLTLIKSVQKAIENNAEVPFNEEDTLTTPELMLDIIKGYNYIAKVGKFLIAEEYDGYTIYKVDLPPDAK